MEGNTTNGRAISNTRWSLLENSLVLLAYRLPPALTLNRNVQLMYPQQTRATLIVRALSIQYEKPKTRFLAWSLPSVLYAAPILHDLTDEAGVYQHDLYELQSPRDVPQRPERVFPRLQDRANPLCQGGAPASGGGNVARAGPEHDPRTVFGGGLRVS